MGSARFAVAALVALLALAACAPAAFGGDYTVSMGEVFGCVNHSWSHSTTMQLYNAYDQFCTGNSVDDIAAAVNRTGGVSYGYDRAESAFVAPAGTWISHADMSWSDDVDLNHNFGVGLHYLDGSGWHNFESCLPGNNCTLGSEALQSTWPGTNYYFPAGTQELGTFAVCAASWCDHTPEGGRWAQAYVSVHSAQVTLHEDATPSISYTGGGLTSGRWIRGIQGVSFNSSDYTGIRRAQLWIDGNRADVVSDPGERGCDYTYTVPCSNISGGSLAFDTNTIGNGAHTFRVSTENAAGNWTDAGPTTFYVDNANPGEVGSVSVAGGQSWHTTNAFNISWTNPPDVAPITTAYYEICDTAGQNCRQGSQSGQSITQLTGVQVPAAGIYKLRVWVADAAGNASGAKSPFVTLEFDGTPPGPAGPVHNNGWVNADQAKGYRQEIDPPALDGMPVSGLAGYAVTVDGSTPGTSVDVPAAVASGYKAFYTFVDLPEGTTTIKARAISGAGVPSTSVGSTVIQVDKTPPTVRVSGNPDENAWSRVPVSLGIHATDVRSGMDPSPSGDPDPTHGGYVVYALDGGSDRRVAGGDAAVNVDSDGNHVVTYQAFDVAGNGATQKSVYFKIDRTPPVAGFEAQNASDPAKVSVLASDVTSGLADGGSIAFRQGATGGWTELPTTRVGNHYVARLNPATMASGTYQFRATVPDQAGNTVTTTNRAQDGGPNSGGTEEIVIQGCRVDGILDPACIVLGGGSGGTGGNGSSNGSGNPLNGPYTVVDNLYQFEIGPDGRPYDYGATVGTFVRAGIVTRKPRKRARPATCHQSKRRRSKRCNKRPPAQAGIVLVSKLQVKYGQGATVHGSVTLANGAPLGDVDVLVLQRYAAAGMRYTLLRTVTTDQSGGFSYAIAPGASRTIAFLYRGSSLYRHSTATIDIAVPAAGTITANKHAVRNGQSVTFSGRLLGGPFPHPGKIVVLQAFYRGKWRAFATTRANDHGAWRYRYRFGATHGVVVYRFRAQISQEAAFPYLIGYSKTVPVRVTG